MHAYVYDVTALLGLYDIPPKWRYYKQNDFSVIP